MRRGIWAAWMGLLVFCCTEPTPAQSPRSPRFHRVTSLERERGPSRIGTGRGGVEIETAVRDRSPVDSLRPYSSRPQELLRRELAASAGAPAAWRAGAAQPVARRSLPRAYFPAWRPGQASNRNVAARGSCAPSRLSFLARGMMSPGPVPSLLPASLGMPGR